MGAAPAGAQAPDWISAVQDRYPSPSPDGKKLLFQSNRTGSQGLWLAEADGTRPVLLVGGADEPSSGFWSPDGNLIVFSALVNGESDIFTIRPDGTGRRRITTHDGDDNHPHFSADGKRIFFNTDRDTPDRTAPWDRRWHSIYSVDLTGGDLRRHFACQTVCSNPTPAPDGRRLVFRRIDANPGRQWSQAESGRNSEIVVADLDGANAVNISNSPAYDTWPSWSPDSQWVYFGSNRNGGPYNGQIFRVRPDGKDLRALTDDPSWTFGEPVASPDGKRLFVSRGVENGSRDISMIAAIDLPAS